MNKLLKALGSIDLPNQADAVSDDLAAAAKDFFPTLYSLNVALDSESEAGTRGLVLGMARAYHALTVETDDDAFGTHGVEPPDIDAIQQVESVLRGDSAQAYGLNQEDLVELISRIYPALSEEPELTTERDQEFHSGVIVGLASVAAALWRVLPEPTPDPAADDEPDEFEEDMEDLFQVLNQDIKPSSVQELTQDLVDTSQDYATDNEPTAAHEHPNKIETLSQLLGELQVWNQGSMPSLAVTDTGHLKLSLALRPEADGSLNLEQLNKIKETIERCQATDPVSDVRVKLVDGGTLVVLATLPDFKPVL